MKTIMILVSILALSIFWGCENDNRKDRVIVTGVLSKVYIKELDVVFPATVGVYWPRILIVNQDKKTPIDDAKVKIWSDSGSVELDTTFIGEYLGGYTIFVDKKRELKIINGNRYFLQVELTDGRIITGTTRVPNDPVIEFPGDNDTLYCGNKFYLNRTEYGTLEGAFHLQYSRDVDSRLNFVRNKNSYDVDVPFSYAFSFGKIDSGVVLLSDNNSDNTESYSNVVTLDSNLSLYSWRLGQIRGFGTDSTYSSFLDQIMGSKPSEYSSVYGDRVSGCFGSFSISTVNFIASIQGCSVQIAKKYIQ
ncbi:hypothetical protein L6Q79_03705 [bacterium]|nr:hypothetical protein [bacterium]NUN46774.1 hypothetical protein [bacterium]